MPHSHYTHLSQEERIIIQNRHENEEDYKDIAKSIKRPRETVWRELRRNGTLPDTKTTRVNKPRADARNHRGSEVAERIKKRKQDYEKRRKTFLVHSKLRYNAQTATIRSQTRTKLQIPLLERPEYAEVLSFVITTLDSGWTPEQIAGRIKLEGIYPYVSAPTIRDYIKNHPELGLQTCLPRKGKQYRYKKAKQANYNQTEKRSIEERPDVVNQLARIGDLEGDTIVGKDERDRLLTHTERRSGLTSISRIIGFDGYKVKEQAICDVIRIFGITALQTITYDNGIEFVYWRLLEAVLQELDADRLTNQPIIYFAHPYRSSERGRNENTNGLIRRFLPKGTDFKTITDNDILMIESLLNNRPRKRLGWLTPSEYYSTYVALED